MAPISRIVLASALAALVAARPLNLGRSPAQVTETAWTTIEVPVTLWVDEKGVPLSTVAGDQIVTAATTTADSQAPTVTSVSTSTSTTTTTTTTAVPESPVAPLAQVATPAPSSASTTTTTTSAWVLPSTSFPQKQVATAAATPAPASGGDSSSAASASSSNSCEGSGAACSGDITHYDGGLGACGWNVNTASDMQIALPVGFMGSQSNGNPYCGRSLTIKNPTTGQTAQATVGDKCMGCVGRSIDLTDALFAAIGGGCDGRCSGFEWWFN